MSRPTDGTIDAARGRLIERSVEDEVLRQRLLDDARGTFEEELGATLPEDLDIRCVEETPETIYLVLPPPNSELSDQALGTIVGGHQNFKNFKSPFDSEPE